MPAPGPEGDPAPAPEAPPAPAEAAPPAETPAPPAEPAAEPEPVPAPPAAPAPAPPAPAESKPAASQAPEESADELRHPNYLPGYRRNTGIGRSPYSPRAGALPGGITPGYGAPLRPKGWTFNWSGFMTVSLQFSADTRLSTFDGQSETVFHVPPETIDEYASFVGTSTVPGNWINMKFSYGNPFATATVSIATWNPTRPTTYYQFGSQYFIHDAFVQLRPDPLGPFRLRFNIGYFSNTYGTLGRYGNGLYSNPIAGLTQGIGETTYAEFDIADELVGVVEHGVMGSRGGMVPSDVIPTGGNRDANPIFPAAYIHHAHVGVIKKGEPELQVAAHYITNWSKDDRTLRHKDDPQTRPIDESRPPNGRITVLGLDARLMSGTWGSLGVGAAYVEGEDAYTLKGLTTYGGEGDVLTDRWWGVSSGGTGTLWVGALNYNVSLGKIVSYPEPFPGDGPDIVIDTGVHVAATTTDFDNFDGRVRHKYGINALYTFWRYMGAGLRIDRVVPNSKDSEETFHVLAPRLQFKSDWNSREVVQIIYARWFYGSRTRNEGTGERTPDRLDDELFALNFNMWW